MSQMATETIIETVVDDLTDHEFDTCCDLINVGVDCDNPARWIALRSCCGTFALMCTPCKDKRMGRDYTVICMACNEAHTPARRAYVYVESLSNS